MSHFSVCVIVPSEELKGFSEKELMDESVLSGFVSEALKKYDENEFHVPTVITSSDEIYEIALGIKQDILKLWEENELDGKDFSAIGAVVKNAMKDKYNLDESDAEVGFSASILKEAESERGVILAAMFFNNSHDLESYDGELNQIDEINPNAKYDWWEIGGRFSKILLYKEGINNSRYTSVARIKDIDWWKNEDEYQEYLRKWDGLSTEHERKYYAREFENRETFAYLMSIPYTHAVLDTEGVWHEKGQMGWFGCSSDTLEDKINWAKGYYEKFIKNEDPESLVIIVDCHI